ncbi:MAG: phage Gp37/Gp68 family protein [Acetobacteraceae bacterium]
MGEQTKIAWCDHTFNPWFGCTKVSPGCDHCYAEGWAKRSGLVQWGSHPRRRASEASWRQPLKWNRKAAQEGVRRKVFCASLADVFDNQADGAWRCDLWDLIWETPNLTWLLLTKRPQNIWSMLPRQAAGALEDWGKGWPNVWLGTTVENQGEADRRIPHLLSVPARAHFLSCEPLLGPVDLLNVGGEWSCLHDGSDDGVAGEATIDWAICGGESGPGARPMHPAWARRLRDQCTAAGVPFFFKQWGDWAPVDAWTGGPHPPAEVALLPDGRNVPDDVPPNDVGGQRLRRVGKEKAGSALDGREWREFPS